MSGIPFHIARSYLEGEGKGMEGSGRGTVLHYVCTCYFWETGMINGRRTMGGRRKAHL